MSTRVHRQIKSLAALTFAIVLLTESSGAENAVSVDSLQLWFLPLPRQYGFRDPVEGFFVVLNTSTTAVRIPRDFSPGLGHTLVRYRDPDGVLDRCICLAENNFDGTIDDTVVVPARGTHGRWIELSHTDSGPGEYGFQFRFLLPESDFADMPTGWVESEWATVYVGKRPRHN